MKRFFGILCFCLTVLIFLTVVFIQDSEIFLNYIHKYILAEIGFAIIIAIFLFLSTLLILNEDIKEIF